MNQAIQNNHDEWRKRKLYQSGIYVASAMAFSSISLALFYHSKTWLTIGIIFALIALIIGIKILSLYIGA